MTSPAFDVQIPATEIEIAEAIRVSDPDVANTVCRLAFQRDRLVAKIKRLRAAINTVRITTVRTVPTHIAEGPYQDAGLENVLVGDWNLIKSLQTGDAGEGD